MQVDPLRKLLEVRNRLSNLRSSLYGNDKLDALLQEVLHNTNAFDKLRSEVGLPEPGDTAEPVREG